MRDYTTDSRIILLSFLAILIGCGGAGLAWVLTNLIALATNIFYYHRWSTVDVTPSGTPLGWVSMFSPVAGGLIIGLIARFGSSKIRGHGIPEAIEAVLLGGAKIEPRVAILKPLSSAISIGSGGPFGAEGPIIMTAGSMGSLVGQLFRLSDAERSTLLVAGAAAGMSGIFATPLAALLLAVELLLFEWRPGSLVPVAVASTTAGVMRRFVLGAGPIFPMQLYGGSVGPTAVGAAMLLGIAAGMLAILLTKAIALSEDFFESLPVHWMWWPAIGGLGVGLMGLVYPPALGAGYDVLADMIGGDRGLSLLLGVLIIKSIMWTWALGSGTSGGILAPLLMIGGALGAAFVPVLPPLQAGAWALVGMAGVLGGGIGCPLTAAVIAVEVTHNYALMLPLLAATMTAFTTTVLLQKRSILTEGLSRRGFHLSREYGVDPLATMTVAEAMRSRTVLLPAETTMAHAADWINPGGDEVGGESPEDTPRKAFSTSAQRLFPVVDEEDKLKGAVSRSTLRRLVQEYPPETSLGDVAPEAVTASPNETLDVLAVRMAAKNVSAMPVVDPEENKVVGLITLMDIVSARTRQWERNTVKTRVRKLKLPSRRHPNEAPGSGNR